jgi:hypothetical protein
MAGASKQSAVGRRTTKVYTQQILSCTTMATRPSDTYLGIQPMPSIGVARFACAMYSYPVRIDKQRG